MRILIAFLSGLLFSIGLTISQMADPRVVIQFLDITGNWSPNLAFVMGGALLVFSPLYWIWTIKKKKTFFGASLSNTTVLHITPALLIGARLFGIGWGLTGICPGPALANITGGNIKIFVFIVVMVFGMKVSEWFKTSSLSDKCLSNK
jgi:uncharacterized membrane protein YedE/YeeE